MGIKGKNKFWHLQLIAAFSLRSKVVPTAKDMEFAKRIIAKELVSRAEIQRHLDDLDDMRKKGTKSSLEQFLINRKVISAAEAKHLRAPKKRIVHCGKCKTMYRAQEEDIGKKFKCKQCGAFVTVPAPGQTEVKRIKEIIGEKPSEEAAMDTSKTIQGVIEKQKQEQAAPATELPEILTEEPNQPQEGGIWSVATPEPEPEMTIMLDLDDEIDEEEEFIAANPITIESSEPTVPEMTIMLDLDDEVEEDEEDHITITSMDLEEEDVEKARAIASASESPEMTIMLDLDDEVDEDEDEIKPVQVMPSNAAQKVIAPTPPSPIPIEEEEAAPIVISQDDSESLEEWAVEGYGAEGHEGVEIATSLEEEKELQKKKRDEMQVISDTESESLEEWAVEGYGAEGHEGVEIATSLEKEKELQKKKRDEMQVISDTESESLEEWAVGGYGSEGNEKVDISTSLENAKGIEFGNSLKPLEANPIKVGKLSPPPKQEEEPEMTIMLDLDDEMDEDEDDDI